MEPLRRETLNFDLTACFTGHRVIPADQKEKIVRRLDETLQTVVDAGIRRFICGGALGFDTLAAQAVLNLKKTQPVFLEMALPCGDQSAHWSKRQQAVYADILAQADKVTTLFERYVTGCMHFRDAYMVDHADVLIAYYRGTPGGTQYTYQYAERRGLKILQI